MSQVCTIICQHVIHKKTFFFNFFLQKICKLFKIENCNIHIIYESDSKNDVGTLYWRSPRYKSDLHFDNFDVRRNTVKWGVIFGVLHGAWLKSEFINNVHYTGGHLGIKSGGHFDILRQGGQIDLHFTTLPLRCNIIKWGIILGILQSL